MSSYHTKGAALLITLSLLLGAGHANAEAQRLLSDPPIDSYLLSCSENPRILITAPSGELLQPESLETRSNGNLIAGFVSLMKLYCPQFKRVTFIGRVDDQLWFAGMTSAAQEWRLTGLYAPPTAGE